MTQIDSNLSSFGTLLKTFRKRQRLTQQQLADVIGVHRSTLINWEQGNYLPESKTIVLELARRLHMNSGLFPSSNVFRFLGVPSRRRSRRVGAVLIVRARRASGAGSDSKVNPPDKK